MVVVGLLCFSLEELLLILTTLGKAVKPFSNLSLLGTDTKMWQRPVQGA